VQHVSFNGITNTATQHRNENVFHTQNFDLEQFRNLSRQGKSFRRPSMASSFHLKSAREVLLSRVGLLPRGRLFVYMSVCVCGMFVCCVLSYLEVCVLCMCVHVCVCVCVCVCVECRVLC